MIELNQIRDAFMKKLADKFLTTSVFGELSKQGFERPAFYVEAMPGDTDIIGPALRERVILIGLHYFVKGDKNRDLWGMAANLDKLFNGVIVVGDRALTIHKAEPRVFDGVLQYWLTLDFTDSLDEADVYGYDSTLEVGGGLEYVDK